MIILKKKNFSLINIKKPSNKIFNLIINNIPRSIFFILGFLFFKKIFEKKLINVYLVKRKKKIASIITTISINNYLLLKKEILNYLIKNPLIIIFNLKFLISTITRNENKIFSNKKNYLHLLHLVIFKKKFNNISLKSKDKLINFFLKIILEINSAKVFFLCYERSNLKAHEYYKRNKYKIYRQNRKTIFIKKKLNK